MKIPNNLALALSGGVARGAFHLGVLDFCEQHNIDIKAYSGSSVGAIISASHASGVKAKEQLKIFSSKETITWRVKECLMALSIKFLIANAMSSKSTVTLKSKSPST